MVPPGERLTFVEAPVPDVANKPSVGMVSQSGAVAVVPGAMRMAKDVGIMAWVSMGNGATSGRVDRVEQLPGDPQTSAIAMIEQFCQPARFLALAERARAADKPVVLLLSGTSSAARKSAVIRGRRPATGSR